MNNIYELLNNKSNDKIAVKFEGKSYSYGQLRADIEELSEIFSSYGVGYYSRVAIYLPNSYSYILTLFACWKLGAIVIPINWINDVSNIMHILSDSSAYMIITQNRKTDLFGDVEIKEVKDLSVCLLHKQSFDCLFHKTTLNDLCLIIYTSGSTGKSKGVMITHYNLYMGTKIVCEYLKINSRDILLSILPFSFDYGLNQVMVSLMSSSTLIIKYPYLFQEIPQIIKNEKVTGLAGMTTIWANILSCKYLRREDFLSLRFVTNSGQAVPERYLYEMKKVFYNAKIYLMYGLTECFRCTYLDPKYFFEKMGSIGKPIPGCEVTIININGEECKSNEVGELVFRGPTVAKGYLGVDNNKVFREEKFNGISKECVVYSGDLVYKDEDDFIYFVGRKDAMIKRYGYRVNAEEINDVLIRNLPYIHECCVISVKKHEEIDPTLIAFITVNNDENIDYIKKDIVSYSLKNMPLYMRIDDVVILNNIPQSNNRKYDTKKLQEMYINLQNNN